MKILTRPRGIEGRKFTVDEAAKLLCVHRITIYRWIGNGHIPESLITRSQHKQLTIALDKWCDAVGVN